MNLHKSPHEFKDLIEATAQHLNLRLVFVEKDYWVTCVLKNLANSEHLIADFETNPNNFLFLKRGNKEDLVIDIFCLNL